MNIPYVGQYWPDAMGDGGVRTTIRAWLAENFDPSWGETVEMSELADRVAMMRTWQARLNAAGWAGIHWPTEHGGRGASEVEQVIVLEELARAGVPHDVFRIGIGFVGPTIVELGTPAQQRELLPPILDGGALWCQGFSEPDSGSDLASLRTRARRTTDGYSLSGQKTWSTYGHLADMCIVLARTGEHDERHRALSAFLVPMDLPGLDARGIRKLHGKEDFSELFFDDVVVPDAALLGEENGGWRVALTMLNFERRTIANWAFRCVAALSAMSVTEMTPGQRRRFVSLASRARLNVLNAYRYAMQGGPTPEFPIASLQKIQSTELWRDVSAFRHEVSPTGSTAAALLESYGMLIAGGTSEIQRNILAERGLGLPR